MAHKCTTFDGLDGLAELWDARAPVRERLRDFQCLVLQKPVGNDAPVACPGSVAKSMDNVRFNSEVLMPVMKKMSENRDSVPDIASLMAEIEKIYTVHKITAASGASRDEAWSLRYLFGKAKTMLYRDAPPECPHFMLGFSTQDLE